MSTIPFVHEFVQVAVPALLGSNSRVVNRIMIVLMAPQVSLQACVTTLQTRGWVQVVDRARDPGRPVPLLYEPSRPQLVFVQFTGEHEALVATQVRSCMAVGSEVVVVGTDFAGLEAFHERHGLCQRYIYLLRGKDDMQPLFDEILRTKLL